MSKQDKTDAIKQYAASITDLTIANALGGRDKDLALANEAGRALVKFQIRATEANRRKVEAAVKNMGAA